LARLVLGFAVAAVALSGRMGKPRPAPARTDEAPPLPADRRELRAGQQATSPTEIPARGWWAVLKRVWHQNNKDNMSIVAAGCAFYALLSLFPGVTALVSIYGIVADPGQVGQQVEAMRGVLPNEAVDLVATQAQQVASGSTGVLGWSAAIALAFALYTVSTGVRTLFTALNIAYEEEETRSFVGFYATAFLFTVGAILAVIVGLGVIIGVPAVLSYLPLGPLAEWTVRIASWLILVTALIGGLAVIYRYGPSRSSAQWRWLTPGAILATVLWLLASAAFSFYVANFASYNETYGTLGGVIILLMWLYISAFVILLGAELNAELELQTAQDTTTGPPQPMGQRQAYAADHTAETRTR
jgi:membrane protein